MAIKKYYKILNVLQKTIARQYFEENSYEYVYVTPKEYQFTGWFDSREEAEDTLNRVLTNKDYAKSYVVQEFIKFDI